MLHPDRESTAFIPSHGWCLQCGATLRVVGTKYFGVKDEGPCCSSTCLTKWLEQLSNPKPRLTGLPRGQAR